MSQESDAAVAVKFEGFVPNSQPVFPHRVEPTVSEYLPERHSMSSPILEIGTIVGSWSRNSKLCYETNLSLLFQKTINHLTIGLFICADANSNDPNDSNVMDLKKAPTNVDGNLIFMLSCASCLP